MRRALFFLFAFLPLASGGQTAEPATDRTSSGSSPRISARIWAATAPRRSGRPTSTGWRPRGPLHAGLHHGAGLLGEPLGVHDGHVSDDHRRPQPPLAPRRRLPAPRRRQGRSRLVPRRGLLHGQRPRPFPQAFDVVGTGKTDWNFTHDGKPFDSDDWSALKPHQPFFAQVNFKETHRAFTSPKRADPAKVVIAPYYPDHPVTREDYAQYLDAASELDEKVGRILKQLDADGLADSTIVVFSGDHGEAHVRGKQFCYDEGCTSP